MTVFIGWGRIRHFELIFKLDIICVLGVLFVLVCEELRAEVVLVLGLIVLAFLHVFIWYLSEYIGRGRTMVVNIDCVYVLLDWLSLVVVFCLLSLLLLWHQLTVEQVDHCLLFTGLFLTCDV